MSGSRRGSHSSQLGRYQFQSPSSFIDAGSSTARTTVAGAIEIGRHPGVVQVTFRAPLERLEQRELLPYVRDQYGTG